MHSYYIYYRLDPARAEGLEARIRTMQEELDQRTGVPGRLLKKRGEPLLWMEIYEDAEDAEAFEQALAELVKAHRLENALAPGSERRVECFVSG